MPKGPYTLCENPQDRARHLVEVISQYLDSGYGALECSQEEREKLEEIKKSVQEAFYTGARNIEHVISVSVISVIEEIKRHNQGDKSFQIDLSGWSSTRGINVTEAYVAMVISKIEAIGLNRTYDSTEDSVIDISAVRGPAT